MKMLKAENINFVRIPKVEKSLSGFLK